MCEPDHGGAPFLPQHRRRPRRALDGTPRNGPASTGGDSASEGEGASVGSGDVRRYVQGVGDSCAHARMPCVHMYMHELRC